MRNCVTAGRHFKYLRNFLGGFFCSLALVFLAPGYASTVEQLKVFESRTKQILEDSDAASNRILSVIEKINLLLEKRESARPVFQSGYLTELASHMERSLALTESYLSELENFLASIDKNSPCYLPETALNLRQLIIEKQQAATQIRALQGTQPEETEAILAVLSIAMNAAETSLMVRGFEFFKLCLVPDLLGLSKSEVEEMQRETELAEHKTQKLDKTMEPFVETYSVSPLEPLVLDVYLPISIDHPEQLSNLTLTHGVTYNQDLEIILPTSVVSDVTQPFEFRIEGSVFDEHSVYQLDVVIYREAYQPLESLTFTNKALQQCVNNNSQWQEASYVEQFNQLDCRFEREQKLAFGELSQLTHLQNISLSNIRIEDVPHSPVFERLSSLQIDSVWLNRFPNIVAAKPVVALTQLQLNDWSSLNDVFYSLLSLDEGVDCPAVLAVQSNPRIFLLKRDMDALQQAEVFKQAEKVDGAMFISTNCW